MTDNLHRLLGVPTGQHDGAQSVPVTFLARVCQACGWFTVFSVALFFVPGERAGTTPFDPTVPELFSLLGLFVFCPLTVLAALVALIRIRLSHNRYKGGWQVGIGLGLAASGVTVFALCACG
jgi:hypothetical protein